MATRKWTAEQQAALEAEGCLTVLSAAAGSGKTTVLVEKALRILLDEENPTSADRLLIATFSNASAKEFKNRIEKGLNQAIKQSPHNPYIKAQKMALQKADICTIHAFCIKLVRENFEILDIPPDFTICDEAKSLLIHEKAIDFAMDFGYTLPDFVDYVRLFGKSSQDKQIREFLKDMFYYFSALPFPEKRAQELAYALEGTDFEETAVYHALYTELGNQIEYIHYLIQRQLAIADIGEVEEYQEGLLQNLNLAQQLMQAYSEKEVLSVVQLVRSGLSSLGRVKRKSDFSTSIGELNKTIKMHLASVEESLAYLDNQRYENQYQQTRKYIFAVTEVFLVYSQKLLTIKKEEKAFEFSDFEHFAVQLLIDASGNETALALELQEKYIKIMEDEFQDTSFVQDMIFTTIAKEKEKNLFVVGDVKQSIYGFRKASPEILLEKRSRELLDPSLGKTIVLPNNFRSEIGVIDSVNYLFERIMTPKVGGISYQKGEQLQPAPNKQPTGQTGAHILICQDKENESTMVARTIRAMVERGETIVEDGVCRKVGYGDFCILLRNTKNFTKFAEALKAQGIPSFVRDDQLLLNKIEVQSVISLIRVINNPLQEVYLTAGMFGDLFGFTLDEVLSVRMLDRKINLYKALALSPDKKSQDFLVMLKDFAAVAKVYSPDKLINHIVNATGYYTRLAFEDGGGVKRENIRWFIAFAKNYAKNYQTALGDFIRYIDLYIQSGKGAASSAQRPPNTVAIMTMHTSKGLEFPICFVSGLGTAFNKMDRSKRLMIDPVLGMATFSNEKFGYNQSTAGIQAIKSKILKANADDEMRLLYVALTRAKNKLFLTAQYTNLFTEKTMQRLREKTAIAISPYAILKANTPMEWILTGYLSHPVLADGVYNKENSQASSFLQFEQVDYQQEALQEEQSETSLQAYSVSCKQAQENFEWVYPHLEKTKLPIKVSVGEIAKAKYAVNLKKPLFVQHKKVSAAQKGTAMHLFVQHTDILLARTNLENELIRLQEKGIVDRKLLNMTQIEKFVHSEVATLILNGEQTFNEKEFLVPYNAAKALNDAEYEKETLLVQGVIDCVVLQGDTAIIVDYKTDRVESMEVLYQRYKKQLELYGYAAQYLYEVTAVKHIIYSFYLNEFITF